MRFFIVALAALATVWAQNPEGLSAMPNSGTTVSPRTWATTATSRAAPYPSYTPQSVSWTTFTSAGTVYQAVVPPRTIAWTTITSGGGVWQIPVSSTSSVAAPTSASETSGSHSSHSTRTIVLSVIFSFLGAVLLLFGAMFFMRMRNQRRMRERRSWAQRSGGWATEEKNAYQPDIETEAHASFAEPTFPAPAPSHTRQRSM